MMRKQLLVILSAAFIAAGAAGGLALKQVSAEESVSGKATVTVKLNGGFRIVTSGDNPSFSTEDYVKQVDGGTVELTHEYLQNNLFGRELIFPLYNGENRPESGTNEVNGVVYDSEGKFYFQVRREINPFESAYLFGVFEDTNNNGVKDAGEKEYRSGDEIEMKDGLVLTCFYEDNNQYNLWTDDDGMCQMAVSLAKAWKKDESNKPAAGTATYYTARQVQPFQMKVNTINPFAYGTGIYYGDTRGIEIPDTVNVLANYAFAFLTQLEYVYGTENVELIAHGAFGSSGCDNGTERTYVVGSIYDLFSSAGTFEYCGAGKFNVVVRGKKSSGSPFNVTSNVKVFQGKNATIEEPKAHVFVPYGMTKDFYPMTTEAGNEYTVAGQSVSGNVASLGGYPMQQIATDGSAISVPLREMQEITFDLNGGRINGKKTIRATYMDAGAKSVTRNGKELNVSETGDSKNGISLNPTAVNYSYLKAQKPAEPVKSGYTFVGWQDENGNIWTEEDWNNGGRAGYETPSVKLTAVYKEWAEIKAASLSLNGDIGLNVYFDINKNALADTQAKVEISLDNGEVVKYNLSEAVENSEGYYGFSIPVAAKDIDKKIASVKFMYSDGVTNEINGLDYSVRDYIAEINSSADEKYSKVKELVSALEKYADSAKNYFGGKSVNYDGADIKAADLEGFVPTLENDIMPQGITMKGISLFLETKTKIRVYFKATEDIVNTTTFKVNGNVVTAQLDKDGVYFIEMDDIAAKNIGTAYTFELGTYKFTYSACSYIYTVLSGEYNSDLSNVVKNLYNYYVAAEKYFK